MSNMAHLTIETGVRPVKEVKEEVEAALQAADDDQESRYPEVYEHHGNVAATRGYRPKDLSGVDVPRVIWTTFNDTVDAGAGNLHERIGDRFIQVENVESPYQEGRYGGYVGDFFRINYGIVPRYGYEETPNVGQTSRPGREDWHSILSTEDESPPMPPEELGAWLDGYPPDGLDPETIRALLDYDPYYRVAGHLFASQARTWVTGDSSESLFDQLDEPDDAERARIVRAAWACGTDDTDQYKELLVALETVDERTKALIAPKLWDPAPLTDDEPPDPSLLTALLDLVDDPVPELRVGAIMGASMVLGHLQKDVIGGKIEADVAFDGVVEPFYEALRELMSDSDVRVRERAVTITDEFVPVTDETIPEFTAANILRPITRDRLDFQDRWAFARAVAEAAAESSSETPDRGIVLAGAFDGEPDAVPTLVEYAYDERGPYYERVRHELARLADDHPDAALGALEPAVRAVEAGTETTADVKLLQALASEAPDRVVPAEPRLETIRDGADEDDKRDAAARTLEQLRGGAV